MTITPLDASVIAKRLVKEWREVADQARTSAWRSESSVNQDVYRASARAYKRCADDLEKALEAAKGDGP